MESTTFLASLQGVLWSKNVGLLDLEKDKIYIIHQILSYGDVKEIRWLFGVYPRKEITQVFFRFPRKVYQPSVFNFVKIFILGLKDQFIDESQYVKSFF